MTRADFLLNTLNIVLASKLDAFSGLECDSPSNNDLLDEHYWNNFKKEFHLNKNVLNFRANASSPVPKKVLNHFTGAFIDIESIPSVKNTGIEEGEKELLRVALAKEISCSPKEVAIMRNTTEALNNAIMGFPFKSGDEVVASVHEYDSMMSSLYQRQKKGDIKIKTIEVPYRPQSKEQIIELFEKSITEKTRMFLVSHIVWISGQIYPLKEICELAKKHDITTVIDAAQSFSHINLNVTELGCDYLGSSLHKWCAAPLGTGFLYVKKDLISKTYPLISSYKYLPDDDAIEKFENYGTVNPVFNSANLSIQFWRKLGLTAKKKRMQLLKEYWTNKLKELPNVEILTNCDEQNSCGIAYFEIKGKGANYVTGQLWEKHKITAEAIENYRNNYVDYKDVNAVGIATPVFITKSDLDKLINAIKSLT